MEELLELLADVYEENEKEEETQFSGAYQK